MAVFVRAIEVPFGDVRLYRLDKIYTYRKMEFEYIIVSQQTGSYVFAAKEDGSPISLLELPGSSDKIIPHAQVVTDLLKVLR